MKPHITVTASAKDMTDLQALKDLLPSTEELGFAWADWVGPISIDTARMLACDCTVTRILLDENGVPLDCGKEARTATVPQRRALAVRDGGCAFPGGCGTPSGVVRCPSYCSLERWRPNRSRQSDLVVRSSPPDAAPHGVAGGDRAGSEIGVLSTDVDRSVSTADRWEQPTDSGVNRHN